MCKINIFSLILHIFLPVTHSRPDTLTSFHINLNNESDEITHHLPFNCFHIVFTPVFHGMFGRKQNLRGAAIFSP